LARPLAWADTHFNVLFSAPAIPNPVNLLTTLQLNDTVTVIRLIVHMFCIPQNLSDDIIGGAKVDMAIGVTATEAFNANVVPDPGSPSEIPARGWLWKDVLLAVKASEAGPPAQDFYWGTELKADIRSMRKVDRGILYFAMEADDIAVSGAFQPINVVGLVRALCVT